MVNTRFWHFSWITWILIISILSFIPGDKLPEIQWNWLSPDTVVHFTLYFVLASLMFLAFRKKLNHSPSRLYTVLVSVGLIFGLAVELIQEFCIRGRFFDYLDLIANSIGTIFGVIIVRLTGIK